MASENYEYLYEKGIKIIGPDDEVRKSLEKVISMMISDMSEQIPKIIMNL